MKIIFESSFSLKWILNFKKFSLHLLIRIIISRHKAVLHLVSIFKCQYDGVKTKIFCKIFAYSNWFWTVECIKNYIQFIFQECPCITEDYSIPTMWKLLTIKSMWDYAGFFGISYSFKVTQLILKVGLLKLAIYFGDKMTLNQTDYFWKVVDDSSSNIHTLHIYTQ